MKKRLSRVTAIILILVMVLAQMPVTFANSTEGLAPTRMVSENKISNKIRAGMESGLVQNAAELANKKAAVEMQALQIDSGSKAEENPDIVPDQLIVKYKAGTSSTMKSALNTKISAVSSKSFDKLGFSQIKLTKGTDIKSAMDKLKDDPSVEYVEPVYVRKADLLVKEDSSTVVESVYCGDTFYTNGWQWGLEAIGMEDMWETVSEESRSQVKIAIIDTGVDIQHSEFAGNILPGYDFVNNDSDADDDNGHGTHVAGIAAAAHEGSGIAGLAGGAKIMPVKVLDEYGNGNTIQEINGILFAVNNGADIINLSLGGSWYSRAEHEAIKYAFDKGVIVVAAAGNNYGASVNYPAAFEEVIAVGAVDWDETGGIYETAYFSNVGPELDILAPGVAILSSIPMELDNPWNYSLNGIGDEKKDGYALLSGTSMAAPFVTGMAAMLLAQNSTLDFAQIVQKLQNDGIPHKVVDINFDSYVLNSGLGIASGLDFRHGVLKSDVIDQDNREFKLYFEDYKGTVTDAVSGTYSLMKRRYSNENGFQWVDAAPTIAGTIQIAEGQGIGTETVNIADMYGTYAYYVEGPGEYLNSYLVCISRDNNNNPGEAQTIQNGEEEGAVLDFPGDEDYFEFTIGIAGYYAIESTGLLNIDGYLYDSGMNEIALCDYGHGNFRIDYDNTGVLELQPGTYYVKVRGAAKTDMGSYGVILIQRNMISGTIALPAGYTTPEDLQVEAVLFSRFVEGNHEHIDYWNDTRIKILAGQLSASFSMLADLGEVYYLGYSIRGYNEDFAYIGYYGLYGTVASINDATPFSAGTSNANMTFIPVLSVDDSEAIVAVNPGQTITGTMNCNGDLDIYEISIREAGSYLIGTEIEWATRGYIWDGILINEDLNIDYDLGRTKWDDDSEWFRYQLYNLQPGKYYYGVYGDGNPFNEYNYQVGVKKSAVISGTISLSQVNTKYDYLGIEVIAESSTGKSYTGYCEIEYGKDNATYNLGVPAANGYTVSYYINDFEFALDPDSNTRFDYAYEGYYSSGGTKADAAFATKVNVSSTASGINMSLLPSDSIIDEAKAQARQISIGTTILGDFNSAADVDYYKFTVPQGGGDYLIETDSWDYLSLYLETEGEWLLYDEDYWSVTERHLSAGIYYLKICMPDVFNSNYYAPYYVAVIGLNKPTATNAAVTGTAKVNSTLSGSYTFTDIDGDTEAGSTYRWLISNTSGGEYTAITGATSKNYRLTSSDLGKYIKFEVTPKTTDNPTTGEAVKSSAIGPIEAAAVIIPGTGGGGGGGGGGGTPSNTATTNEQTSSGTAELKTAADGTITVEFKVDGSKLNTAISTPGSAPVAIDVHTKANQDNLEVRIPSTVFSQAAAAQKPIVVNSNNADFTFQPGTFDTAGLKGEVKLEVSQLTTDSIPDAMKKKDAANNDVSLVFDFDLSIDGNKVTDFNKPVTITIKIDPSKVTDMSKVGVYYYNEKDGIWEYVGGTVNPDGTVTFTVDHFSMYVAMEYKKSFVDVAGHWAKADIELLLAKHVARGENETSFAPNSSITRAAFASMIVKALDIKGVKTDKLFEDIQAGSWYKEDIYKAYATGIIGGVSSTEFAPDQLITREQMATMLMRAYEYATGKKLDEMVTTMNVRFNDESSISDWAKRNVILANATGFVKGNPDGTYSPKGNTTKAQAAVVIKRLMEKLNRL